MAGGMEPILQAVVDGVQVVWREVWGLGSKVVEGLERMWNHLSPFERHDLFNVLSLLPVAVLEALAFTRPGLRRALMIAFGLYTLSDTAWVLAEPKSVKDPRGIVAHHALAFCLLFIPTFYPEYRVYAMLALTAEFNTWILITKRHVRWRPLRWLMEGLFYSSWVLIRLMLYPWLLTQFIARSMDKVNAGIKFHPVMLTPVIMGLLCVMQFKWSYDLINKRMLNRNKDETKQE